MTKQEFINKAKLGVVRFSFEKKDGTLREMNGTLSESMVPYNPPTESAAPSAKKTSDQAQAIWDMDLQAWRSFRWDSVRTVEFQELPKGIQ